VKKVVQAAVAWPVRWRRAAFVAKLRLKARLAGAEMRIDVAPDARIGRAVRVHVVAGSRANAITIDRSCLLDDDVFLRFGGGQLVMGPGCSIRRGAVISVGGRLELCGSNVISYRTVIHCAERVTLGRQTIVGEMATIVDSRHFHSDPTTWVYETTESKPIAIGENVWIAAKAPVGLGVTIGDRAAVGANRVVTADVAPETLVAGIPATPIRGTMRSERPTDR
jgi:acetyltransferase-like isoleucine patch superfamily enzyme